jgi:metallophosphoesterase superfamily enzyme
MRLHDEWLFTPDRFLFHLPTRTAVLADMHLGYVAARRGDGEAVPHFGETERLDDLVKHLDQLRAAAIVVAGDLVESARHGQPIVDRWSEQLAGAGIALHLVPGNHDRGLLAGHNLHFHPDGYFLGDWTVRHDADLNDPRPTIFGHLHPCLRSALAPGEAACFLASPTRLLLPAWCDHASGVSIFSLGDWPDADCYAIAAEQVIALGPVCNLKSKLRRRYTPFRIGSGLGT